jgi:hypothetical protein
MIEVDARMSDGTLISLEYDAVSNESFVILCDEHSSRRLVAKDRAEAIEMFRHPFVYAEKYDAAT